MGSSTFTKVSENPDTKEAFKELKSEDRHRNGHGSYSGTISQKSGYTLRKLDPMPKPKAMKFAREDVLNTDKRERDAFAVPFFDADSEVTEVEDRVRAASREAAVDEALDRAGFGRDDVDNLNAEVTLEKKGYTAKLDKSESVEKEVTYEVARVSGSPLGEILISEELCEELKEKHPNMFFGYGDPRYHGPGGREFDSYQDARSAIMTHFAVVPEDDGEYEIREIKKRVDTTTFTARETASEVPTWSVRVEAETYDVPEDPDVEGYLFYGWANE